MAVTLPAGKLRNLLTLADEAGRLKMMAIDQRMSMERALQGVLGREPRYEEMLRRQPCYQPTGCLSDDELLELADDIERLALITDVSWAITAAFGIAAIVVLFVDPGNDEESTVRVARNADGTLAAAFVWGGL